MIKDLDRLIRLRELAIKNSHRYFLIKIDINIKELHQLILGSEDNIKLHVSKTGFVTLRSK